jgi:gamma-glutamyl:cysteine ligase YbdK (ATP-grasp superfamily)
VTSNQLDLRIVSKGATTEEIAAVAAVLQAALDEMAARMDAQAPVVSAWQRSQRGLRTPLRPGPGAWRGFSG